MFNGIPMSTYHLIGLLLHNLRILSELLGLSLFTEDQSFEEAVLDSGRDAEILEVEVLNAGKESFICFRTGAASLTTFLAPFRYNTAIMALKDIAVHPDTSVVLQN